MKKQKGTQLLEKFEIKETPFTIIKDNERETYFGVLGQYRMTEEHKTKEEAITEITKMTWNNILNVIIAIHNIQKDKEP